MTESKPEPINNEIYELLKTRAGRNKLRSLLGLTPEPPEEEDLNE